MNHSLRWGLMLMLVLVLSLTACTRAQDDPLAENPEGQATEESSGSLFGAPEGEGDAAAEAAAVEAPAAEGEAAPAAEGEAAPAAEGEAAPAAEGETAPAAEGETAPAAEAAAEAGTVETTTEGEAAPEPQATTIAIDEVTPEEGSGETAAAQASGDVYTVAEGDTLLSIAEKNSTTVDELRALNNLTSNFIYVGQQLNVPTQVVNVNDTSGDTAVEATSEGSGETAAEGSGETVAEGSGDAAASGETTTEAPAESASTTTTDGSGNIIHVVKENEWVYDIARKYEGVSPQDILNANNLTNPDVVVPGQELIIPVK